MASCISSRICTCYSYTSCYYQTSHYPAHTNSNPNPNCYAISIKKIAIEQEKISKKLDEATKRIINLTENLIPQATQAVEKKLQEDRAKIIQAKEIKNAELQLEQNKQFIELQNIAQQMAEELV